MEGASAPRPHHASAHHAAGDGAQSRRQARTSRRPAPVARGGTRRVAAVAVAAVVDGDEPTSAPCAGAASHAAAAGTPYGRPSTPCRLRGGRGRDSVRDLPSRVRGPQIRWRRIHLAVLLSASLTVAAVVQFLLEPTFKLLALIVLNGQNELLVPAVDTSEPCLVDHCSPAMISFRCTSPTPAPVLSAFALLVEPLTLRHSGTAIAAW